MIVYYRITDNPSTNPPPIFEDDKPRLNKICLKSFIKAYENIDYNIYFICDYCRPETIEMIKSLCPEGEIVQMAAGINETCVEQYRLYEKSEEPTVLFLECDYYHLKPITEKMIRELEVVSPYDHPDKYETEREGQYKIADNQYFKYTASTTATFACTSEYFNKNKIVLYKHGYIDHERWVELGGLWTPIPTMATHMVTSYLPPNIEWKNRFTQ